MSDEKTLTSTQVKTKTVSKTAMVLALAFLGISAIAAGLVALPPQSYYSYGYTCWDSDYTTVNDLGMPMIAYSFINSKKFGQTYGLHPTTKKYSVGTDQCVNLSTITEFFCNKKTNRIGWKTYKCPTGSICLNGVCVKKTTPQQ